MMLKAVLIDSSAVARGLLNTVLIDGGYDVCGQTHTSALGLALLVKHRPHFVCIAREQVEDGTNVVQTIREQYPKTLIFMISGTLPWAYSGSARTSGTCSTLPLRIARPAQLPRPGRIG